MFAIAGNSASNYNLQRSLRFRASASAYLNRTLGTPTDSKKFTYSTWMKRGKSGGSTLFGSYAGDVDNFAALYFNANDQILYYDESGGVGIASASTERVFRDFSAWCHIVFVVDTSQATAANRMKFYVNGVQATFSAGTQYSLNDTTRINFAGRRMQIGATFYNSTLGDYFDGYLAETYFIDGQALTPSSFGSTNSTTGVWQPAQYKGTYGANGFYLPFTDTTTTLLSNSSNISAPFGGIASNALVPDTVYCTSNMSSGSVFTFLLNDFGTAKQVTSYSISSLYFSGGSSTFLIQSSQDNSTWTTVATLSVSSTAANFAGTLNTYARYFRLYVSAYGVNGQAGVDAFLLNTGGIGLDFSDNGNCWTTNNISITAGVTYDSMTDVPTLTSSTAANFAVLNPVTRPAGVGAAFVTSGGNLNCAVAYVGADSTIAMSSGKWYWEVIPTSNTASNNPRIGIVPSNHGTYTGTSIGDPAGTYGYASTGQKGTGGTYTSYGASFTDNDVIGVALDMTAGTLVFYKNGVSQGTAFTGLTGEFFASVGTGSSTTMNLSFNFGQRPFSYTPPSGFVALNTYNLPDSTIKQGNKVMDATLWTGNGGASQVVNNQGSFQPDLVWTKTRNQTGFGHLLFDSVRGASLYLQSNGSGAETTDAAMLSSFNSNGITVGSSGFTNGSGNTEVAWQWQAGQGVTSTNTAGSITSTVSVNPAAGFSIVSLTGPASGAFTAGHGLGVPPGLIIAKIRNGTGGWPVYHAALGPTGALQLESTGAFNVNAGYWNNTAPTSSVFTSNIAWGATQQIFYCWAEIPGYSKFGNFQGNASVDGPFVYLGFRPKFIMFKNYAAGGYSAGWTIVDSSRSTYNVVSNCLQADTSGAEFTYATPVDFLSNGFKIRTNWDSVNNASPIAYIAFAENPFKNSLAR